MPTISYKIEGRFGNNLIQYCIAKLLCKLFGHTLINRHERGSYVIRDYDWKLLYPSLIQNKDNPEFFRKHMLRSKNIRLEGFFQDSTPLITFRPYLTSLFTVDNPDSINATVTVKQVAEAIQRTPDFSEIVTHLRMDDFKGAGKDHSSVILHPQYFHNIIPDCIFKYNLPLRIVYERKIEEKEQEYVNEFVRYGPIYQSSDMLIDFATLVKAKVLISSNSTFSWMAAFLAKDQHRVLPTICHMGDQQLGKIDSSDTVKESFFVSL